MCLTAHGLTAALLLTKEFPPESPCEDSAFLAFLLRNFWNILFINSLGSTLVTIDVASCVCPQAFHGWLLSCRVLARLCGAASAALLVCAAACSRKPPCSMVLAALLLGPVLHGTCLQNMALALISGCPAVNLVCKKCQYGPFPGGGKRREHAVDVGLRHHALAKRYLRCQERCPSALAIGNTELLHSLKNCEIYRKKG